MIDRYEHFATESRYFEDLAREYGRLYLSMDGTGDGMDIEEVCFEETSVDLLWKWYGNYGAYDTGNIHVLSTILCNRDLWVDHIQAEIDAKHLKASQTKQAELDRLRCQKIEAAKKLLQDEGLA